MKVSHVDSIQEVVINPISLQELRNGKGFNCCYELPTDLEGIFKMEGKKYYKKSYYKVNST